MAIEAQYLGLLRQAIDRGRASGNGVLRALLLAYPDMLVSRAGLAQMLGEASVASLPVREDSAAAWSYHGLAGVADPMFDSIALLRGLGVEPVVIDVAAHRGDERIVDLNHPLPDDLARSFDLVVDTGTCEHCFNVGQAFMNACEALRAGGTLLHAAPLNRINHGFWSFNPTIYPDFFEANGFDLQVMTGVTGTIAAGMTYFPVEAFGRFDPPPNSALYVVAQRREVRALAWPVQRKYRGMIR